MNKLVNSSVAVVLSTSLLLLLILDECYSDLNVDGHMPPKPRRHAMDARHESDHIKEHLDEMATVPDLQSMSPEEMEFHYFKLHDYDNNNKLDGNEIGKALTHYDRNDIVAHESEPTLTDEQLAGLIDSVLKEEDANQDGYVDYSEFVAAQKREGHEYGEPQVVNVEDPKKSEDPNNL